MNKDNYHLPESNFHLPRCLCHTLECITDKLADHEEWILRNHNTLDSLYPAGLCLKAEEFVCTKSDFADRDPSTLPKDICPIVVSPLKTMSVMLKSSLSIAKRE